MQATRDGTASRDYDGTSRHRATNPSQTHTVYPLYRVYRVPSTILPGWVRVGLGRSWSGYELVWVRVFFLGGGGVQFFILYKQSDDIEPGFIA